MMESINIKSLICQLCLHLLNLGKQVTVQRPQLLVLLREESLPLHQLDHPIVIQWWTATALVVALLLETVG